jgi:hypothetical protein
LDMIERCAAHSTLVEYLASLVPMCFVYTGEAFVCKIDKLRNSIHEELNGFSCKILWRNSLAPAKLPHGTNGSNGLKRTLTTVCSGRRRAPSLHAER